MGAMNVSELGEFGLIRHLADALGSDRPDELIVGIGDDAAVWRSGETYLLATTDTLVEGVHFPPHVTPWRDLGWKALAVNVSDIAAMGGEPLFALVTLGLPPDTDVSSIDDLYAGVAECARSYAVTIAGGDIVRAPQFSVTVALLGRAGVLDGKPLLLRRDAARAGDVFAVTGTLGDSAAGLRLLKEGAPPDDLLVRAHLHPQPPLALAHEAARLGIRCGIDVSDGLLQDIGHICEMSAVSADIHADAVPLSDELRAACPRDALMLAVAGGEDYQMVFAGPPHVVERLEASIVGEVTDRPGHRPRLLDAAGDEMPPAAPGWDHLRRP